MTLKKDYYVSIGLGIIAALGSGLSFGLILNWVLEIAELVAICAGVVLSLGALLLSLGIYVIITALEKVETSDN